MTNYINYSYIMFISTINIHYITIVKEPEGKPWKITGKPHGFPRFPFPPGDFPRGRVALGRARQEHAEGSESRGAAF